MLISYHCLFHLHLNQLICTCALCLTSALSPPCFTHLLHTCFIHVLQPCITCSSHFFHTCSSHFFIHVLPINVSHMIHSSVSHLFFTPVFHTCLTHFLHTHVSNMFFTPVFHMCSSHLPYFIHLLHTCSFVRCSGRTSSRNKCLFHTWLRMCFTPFSDP